MSRMPLLLAGLLAFGIVLPAAAQSARATGTVKDSNGRAIRGAIVRATNEMASPSQIASTTDNKGRWAMIGLASGQWEFSIEAEGFVPERTGALVRVGAPPRINTTLQRDLGPLPDALDRDIGKEIAEAHALRDRGRLDEALEAYQDIQEDNPKLTLINLVIADTYRRKAAQEQDPERRAALFEEAIRSYTDVLQADAGNERAQTELASVRAQMSGARVTP